MPARCYPCPRTPVTHVSGTYKISVEGTVEGQREISVVQSPIQIQSAGEQMRMARPEPPLMALGVLVLATLAAIVMATLIAILVEWAGKRPRLKVLMDVVSFALLALIFVGIMAIAFKISLGPVPPFGF
jgi:hypothetical protein